MENAAEVAVAPAQSRVALGAGPLGAVLTVGLVARLLVLWTVGRHLSAAWFFHRGTEMGFLAQSLLEGKGLGSPFGAATGPTAFIAPGYPVFVALMFKVFGSYSMASALVLMSINVAFNLVTIWLIMRVTVRLANVRAAVLGGIFWALSPVLVWMPTIFWETNISCCMLVAALACALEVERAPEYGRFLLAGAALAIAGLINPAMLPALLGMLGYVAYRFRRVRPYGMAVALVALVVVFSPWPIRNARVFHAFIPLRSTVGFEMWMGNRPGATGYLDESLFPTFNPGELQSYERMGEVAYVANKSAEARQYIVGHPVGFLKLSARRVWRFWTGSGTKGAPALYMVHACVTSVLGLLGLGYLARRRPAMVWLFAMPLVLFPAPYYLTHAEFRYRLNVDAVMTILAAYALSALMKWPEKRACGS
jgi:hypothetical protein